MHEKLLIANLLYFLFPGLPQEYLDLSFWFEHKPTPLNNEQVHGIIVLSERQLLIRRFSAHLVTRFIQDAIFNHCAHMQKRVPCHHACKAWLHNNNIMVLDLIAIDLGIMGRGPGLATCLQVYFCFKMQISELEHFDRVCQSRNDRQVSSSSTKIQCAQLATLALFFQWWT